MIERRKQINDILGILYNIKNIDILKSSNIVVYYDLGQGRACDTRQGFIFVAALIFFLISGLKRGQKSFWTVNCTILFWSESIWTDPIGSVTDQVFSSIGGGRSFYENVTLIC